MTAKEEFDAEYAKIRKMVLLRQINLPAAKAKLLYLVDGVAEMFANELIRRMVNARSRVSRDLDIIHRYEKDRDKEDE